MKGSCLAIVGLTLVIAMPGYAQSSSNNFVAMRSSYGRSTTLNWLEYVIKSDGLMVLGQVKEPMWRRHLSKV